MVYSTSAAAFLHMSEHQHLESHTAEHQPDAEHGHQHDSDSNAEHAHHFNLHLVGDLIEHDALSFSQVTDSLSGDLSTRLVSRSYTPPIPPPNA